MKNRSQPLGSLSSLPQALSQMADWKFSVPEPGRLHCVLRRLYHVANQLEEHRDLHAKSYLLSLLLGSSTAPPQLCPAEEGKPELLMWWSGLSLPLQTFPPPVFPYLQSTAGYGYLNRLEALLYYSGNFVKILPAL